MKSEPAADPACALERLSALSDGACDARELKQSLEEWRCDAQLRAAWHRYALIGDVLRSEDLASDVRHDEDFLRAFRARMVSEPVVLAPMVSTQDRELPAPEAPEQQPRQVAGAELVRWPVSARRRAWVAPTAVAAGFMMVAGAVLVWRGMPESQQPAGMVLAQGAADSPRSAASGQWLADADLGALQRNADLDRYLNAHRQFVQGASLAAPGGVRQVVLTPVAP